MGTIAKKSSRKEIKPGIFEITTAIHASGSCQCFKDCDCYLEKGKFLYNDIRYSNGIKYPITGKERTYSTLKGCEDSLEAYNKKLKAEENCK